eukprot:CAMPEP_0177740818 /NCGR_PEP_ID=MMETSP0484_2-20121128/27778_1 /TAXON_ID=354590 /ORGANISM="Rhodomonas lens, Strain RHODO" /LENGTH=115 /DNA_ID=CAMNT_0019255005 /DNA_START=8 /DNA_END=355 /DNA_ORIENTATION=+
MPRGPYPGVPDSMFASQECFTCRVHVMVTPKMRELYKAGAQWYVGVLGAHTGVSFKLRASLYQHETLKPNSHLAAMIPSSAVWSFFRLDLSAIVPGSKSASAESLANGGTVGSEY